MVDFKVGLGTYKHQGKSGTLEIAKAIEYGYRLIDTADHYKNHKEVGDAVKVSKISRSDICICTKIWKDRLEYNSVVFDVKRFLNELQTDYIDILLIHWPNKNTKVNQTLSAFSDLKYNGLIKNFGVSNFTISHLKKVKELGYNVGFNQIEYHPSLNQKDLKYYCDKNNIKVMAHSALGGGLDLKIPEIKDLADKHKKTSAQILYAWLINQNIIPIAGFDSLKHLKENFESAQVNLLNKEVELINNLNLSKNRVLIKDYSEF
jgi:diketogulonate reductase-like aldo/keto reductase